MKCLHHNNTKKQNTPFLLLTFFCVRKHCMVTAVVLTLCCAEKKKRRRRVVVKTSSEQQKTKHQVSAPKIDRRTREYRAAQGLPTRQPRGAESLDPAKVPGNPRFPLSEWSLTITKIKGDVAVGDIDIIHKCVSKELKYHSAMLIFIFTCQILSKALHKRRRRARSWPTRWKHAFTGSVCF